MASTATIDNNYDDTIGIIYTMNQKGSYVTRHKRKNNKIPWCLDNGVFTNKFNYDEWIIRIEHLSKYSDTCLFVVMPDTVGDALSTLMKFKAYRDTIKRDFDLPVALVSQDGIYKYRDFILWDELDCIFIGGSDEHKLGREGGWILNEAKARGKWVHVGRVNSRKRLLKFWRADSWDGTDTSIAPAHAKNYHAAVLQVRAMKQQKGLFNDLHTYVSRRYHSGKLGGS